MQLRRLLIEWFLIGIAASLILIIAEQTQMLERPDHLVYDLVSPLRAPPANKDIVIVAIDNQTLTGLGRWPWQRSMHTPAIINLKAAHPESIIYNILFIEPSSDDVALAAAIGGQPPLFLPTLFEEPGPDGAAKDVLRPDPRLANAAAGLGTADLDIDSDGRTRSVRLVTHGDGMWMPHLTELAYRVMRGKESPAFQNARTKGGEPVYLAFQPAGSFRTITFLSLVRGQIPSDALKGKTVIVGATATGLGDLYPVPGSSRQMSGAEIQANVLSSLLANRFITPLSPGWSMILSLLPLWLLLGAFWRLSPSQALAATLGIMAAFLAASGLLLATAGIWFSPVAGLIGITIIYPLWGWRRLTVVSRFIEREIDHLLRQNNLKDAGPVKRGGGDRIAEGTRRLHQVITLIRRNALEREQMLQFLSHDMRAPQAAIIALLDSSGSDQAPTPDGTSLRIRRYAETTLSLADDFVQLARLESRRDTHEPVDVTDAMSQAIDIVWPAANRGSVTIQRQWSSDEDLWVMGDAAALVRAFTNLLSNAVHASGPSGSIWCEVARDSQYSIASISDEGPGLPPERRERPFARFGYSATSRAAGGSGLGLAFVEAVAHHHGGRAFYQDREGGGARFIIHLPLMLETDEPESQ